MSNNVELVERAYNDFNARRIEAVLSSMHPDVTWANGMEGGYVHGREGVREYWTRQWAIIDPHVEPVHIVEGEPGTVEVEVRQTVRDLKGAIQAEIMVKHAFRVENGLIRRFDIG
jgi:SnoaL-like domain